MNLAVEEGENVDVVVVLVLEDGKAVRGANPSTLTVVLTVAPTRKQRETFIVLLKVYYFVTEEKDKRKAPPC